MKSFLLAVQFLTLVPLKVADVDEGRQAKSMIYFPVAGLLLGFALAGLSAALFALHFYEFTVAAMSVVALAAITGGMHLDGLSDTFDALMSNKDREKCLEIMRDPHVGAMGVISIVCVLLLKTAFIFSLRPYDRLPVLILMCVLSRWSMVGTMFLFPYARREGKARVFMNNMTPKIFLITTAIALAISVFVWQWKGLLFFAVSGFAAWLFSSLVSRRFGGITGDTLGASCELNELAVLAAALFLGACL